MRTFSTPWDTDPQPAAETLPEVTPRLPKKRGRRPTPTPVDAVRAPDGQGRWLYHHLTITGPQERIAAFAVAAQGPGIVPWPIDGARIEEDIFNLAVSQPKAMRSLTVEGCRILARQFRELVEARAARAAALLAQSRASSVRTSPGVDSGRAYAGRACPFDLATLLPVPAAVLLYEVTHPKAQAWLQENWGLSDLPRQVVRRPEARPGRRLPAGHTVLGYGFFTPGETPHAAVATLAAAWPDLRFLLQPLRL